jgi:hypothetical protein
VSRELLRELLWLSYCVLLLCEIGSAEREECQPLDTITKQLLVETTTDREHPLCPNKQKSSDIMKMKMFATLDKARPHTENIRGLNLAAVMCTAVQVSNTAVVD